MSEKHLKEIKLEEVESLRFQNIDLKLAQVQKMIQELMVQKMDLKKKVEERLKIDNLESYTINLDTGKGFRQDGK